MFFLVAAELVVSTQERIKGSLSQVDNVYFSAIVNKDESLNQCEKKLDNGNMG